MVKMAQLLWKTAWQLLSELNVLCDSAIPLSISWREMRTCSLSDTCTQIRIAAVFMIGKNWNEVRLFSGWMDKHTHAAEHNSAVRRNSMGETQEFFKWRKQDPGSCPYSSIYKTFPEDRSRGGRAQAGAEWDCREVVWGSGVGFHALTSCGYLVC
jgi:hypothetical protein